MDWLAKIESARMRAALLYEISIYDLYNIFDTQDRGYLLLEDFVNGLRRFGIVTQRDEA